MAKRPKAFESIAAVAALFDPKPDYPYFERTADHPFDPRAEEFSPGNALLMAEASLLAYMRDPEFIRNALAGAGFVSVQFPAVDPESKHQPCCIVARHLDFMLVIFRGTQPGERAQAAERGRAGIWSDFFTDSKFLFRDSALGGRVHAGFEESLDAVWPALIEILDEPEARDLPIWFTGHSLGGALAVLSADRFARRADVTGDEPADSAGSSLPRVAGVYTFGCPRVGDTDFRQGFAPRVFRMINDLDMVPHLPPKDVLPGKSYCHVGDVSCLETDGKLARGTEPWRRRKQYRKALGTEFGAMRDEGIKAVASRLRDRVRLLTDHAPIHYCRRLRAAIDEKLKND